MWTKTNYLELIHQKIHTPVNLKAIDQLQSIRQNVYQQIALRYPVLSCPQVNVAQDVLERDTL